MKFDKKGGTISVLKQCGLSWGSPGNFYLLFFDGLLLDIWVLMIYDALFFVVICL